MLRQSHKQSVLFIISFVFWGLGHEGHIYVRKRFIWHPFWCTFGICWVSKGALWQSAAGCLCGHQSELMHCCCTNALQCSHVGLTTCRGNLLQAGADSIHNFPTVRPSTPPFCLTCVAGVCVCVCVFCCAFLAGLIVLRWQVGCVLGAPPR